MVNSAASSFRTLLCVVVFAIVSSPALSFLPPPSLLPFRPGPVPSPPSRLFSSDDIADVLLSAEEKMAASVTSLSTQLSTLRTGRATPNLLDRVQVSYYGSPTPLTSLATVTVQGGQQLLVTAFDKSTTSDIERAIIESDLGLTPNSNGDAIRLNIPQLTEDRRKELVKTAGSIAEKAKVSIRNARRDASDRIKKVGVGEDEERNALDDCDKLTKRFEKDVEEKRKEKEEELKTV